MSIIDKADQLMKAEKKEEAKALLVGLLQEHPNKKGYYADAVSIYLYGNMYHEAKEIFKLYKERFNQELRSDFSLDEIEKEEKEFIEESKLYQGSDVKVFKPSSWALFQALKEIRISQDKIVLKHRSAEYSYTWSEISDAIIKKSERPSAQSKWDTGKRVEKILELKTHDKTFRFAVDDRNTDFKRSDILLQELKKHIKIQEEKYTKRIKETPWWIPVTISFGCIFLLVTHKIDLWIAVVIFAVLMIITGLYEKPR